MQAGPLFTVYECISLRSSTFEAKISASGSQSNPPQSALVLSPVMNLWACDKRSFAAKLPWPFVFSAWLATPVASRKRLW